MLKKTHFSNEISRIIKLCSVTWEVGHIDQMLTLAMSLKSKFNNDFLFIESTNPRHYFQRGPITLSPLWIVY